MANLYADGELRSALHSIERSQNVRRFAIFHFLILQFLLILSSKTLRIKNFLSHANSPHREDSIDTNNMVGGCWGAKWQALIPQLQYLIHTGAYTKQFCIGGNVPPV